eukprot:753947-Hanusia_phi.AAC.4
MKAPDGPGLSWRVHARRGGRRRRRRERLSGSCGRIVGMDCNDCNQTVMRFQRRLQPHGPLGLAREMADEEEEETAQALTEELISDSLSGIESTIDGRSVAFTTLNLEGKKIEDISPVSLLEHIRYAYLSRNLIKDLSPLSNLHHLLSLKLDNNKLEAVDLGSLSFLQFADLSNNKLGSWTGVDAPLLRYLDLSFNRIQTVSGLEKNPQLQNLFLHGNELETCEGTGHPSIKEITLHKNKISDLQGLSALVNVKKLNLSENNIASLNGLPLGELVSLDLRQNQLSDVACLTAVQATGLRELNLEENPVAENLDRINVLRTLSSLTSLNGVAVTPQEQALASEPLVEEGEQPASE